MAPAPDFIHRFVVGARRSGPVLLLLHGTGGSEDDLLDLGEALLPGATLLSPRGRVRENGMPRFFRRLAEGVFDEEDLIARTHELADFVAAARDRYGLDNRPVVAVGYSNGANIAASLMLLRPDTLAGAVLWRAMVPLIPATLPDLTGRPVLLASGCNDPIVSPENAERLAGMLERAGARVTRQWTPGGHPLGAADVDRTRLWLEENFPAE
jgi:predicted esterase